MTKPQTYFRIARNEEKAGNLPPALLHYVSAFCAAYNCGYGHHAGTVAKIRNLQRYFQLTDSELCELARSYGPLTDAECQHLLYYAIYGNISGIHAVLNDG